MKNTLPLPLMPCLLKFLSGKEKKHARKPFSELIVLCFPIIPTQSHNTQVSTKLQMTSGFLYTPGKAKNRSCSTIIGTKVSGLL